MNGKTVTIYDQFGNPIRRADLKQEIAAASLTGIR